MVARLHTTFGDRVRDQRKRRGVSQERLGEMAGLHRTYIGHVERGEVNATLTSIVRIANALEVDPAHLVEGLTGDPSDGKHGRQP